MSGALATLGGFRESTSLTINEWINDDVLTCIFMEATASCRDPEPDPPVGRYAVECIIQVSDLIIRVRGQQRKVDGTNLDLPEMETSRTRDASIVVLYSD